jgi:lysyl-tRNA synthetase class I
MAQKTKAIDERYPEISDTELKIRYEIIKPVVKGSNIEERKLNSFITRWATEQGLSKEEKRRLRRDANSTLFWIKDVDPKKIAFNWDPTPIGVATSLQPVSSQITYHTYGYHGFFKAGVGEVLAQINDEDLDRARAFSIEPKSMKAYENLTEDYKYLMGKVTFYVKSDGGARRLLRGKGTNE